MALEDGIPGYPRLDPEQHYTTAEAAAALRTEATALRKWRLDNYGPKYRQFRKNAPVDYLGLDLIKFRDQSIKTPEVPQ